MTATPPQLCACPHYQGPCGRPSASQCAACGAALCMACDLDTDGEDVRVGPGICEDCYFKEGA